MKDSSYKAKPAQYADQINLVLDNFNYERMHSIMQHLDWRWVQIDPDNETNYIYEIPSIERIRSVAEQLLIVCIKHQTASTGGLHARLDRQTNELSLQFIPVQYVAIDPENE